MQINSLLIILSVLMCGANSQGEDVGREDNTQPQKWTQVSRSTAGEQIPENEQLVGVSTRVERALVEESLQATDLSRARAINPESAVTWGNTLAARQYMKRILDGRQRGIPLTLGGFWGRSNEGWSVSIWAINEARTTQAIHLIFVNNDDVIWVTHEVNLHQKEISVLDQHFVPSEIISWEELRRRATLVDGVLRIKTRGKSRVPFVKDAEVAGAIEDLDYGMSCFAPLRRLDLVSSK